MNHISSKPYALVGAGRLTAAIWKTGDETTGWSLGFSVFRCEPVTGEVTQRLTPDDIGDLPKLARVLSQVIADDGCVSSELRHKLTDLAQRLDDLWESDELRQCNSATGAYSEF